ncbi:LPXTG cell wall anchor domain-containing protein [Dactylosporangium sp. NPDC051485]|uniref:LPXTG cell wall anchor domain-containing protein n=1 Tax=Dactylosporangium sp. NPDC051485 TaxID=3154846 RepID=UPI0034201DB4
MPSTKRARALGLGAALAAVTLAVAPAGLAHAEDSPSLLASPVTSTISVGAGNGKVVYVDVFAHNAVNPVLTIDFSALKIATVVPLIDECKAAAAKVTCTLPDGSYDGAMVPFTIKAVKGAQNGQEGTYTIATKADNVPGNQSEAHVKIADGVDLVAVDESDGEKPAKPGDVVWMPATFYNAGNQAADHAAFTFSFDNGIVPDQYEGCTYGTTAFGGTTVTCPLDEPLQPGMVVTFVTDDGTEKGHRGMAAKVTADAYGSKAADFFADPGAEEQSRALARSRTQKATSGKKFSTLAVQPVKDINDFDNYATYMWKIGNRVDVASIGATASGKVGDVVKINIGIKNNGPAALDAERTGGEPSWEYDFVVPDGTEVVLVPDNCSAWWHESDGDHFEPKLPGKRFYACFNYEQVFKPGGESHAEFSLKITEVIANATGTVSFTNPFANPAERHDDNPANDLAEVVINPKAGGSGGGGALPLTGAKVAGMAGVGALLLVGGVVLFLVSRRRRVVLVTPEDGGIE